MPDFNNATFIQAVGGQPFAIQCNTTETRPIVWVQTINGTGVFTVPLTSRVFTSQNGLTLNFAIAQLVDQEYYACAYYDSANSLRVLNSFNLYVKVYPVLTIVVGTTVYNESDTIVLNAPGTYQLACLSVQSKPDVDLVLYDSNRFLLLGNSSNSQSSHRCNQTTNLCDVIYQVTFDLSAGSPFLTMTSLTCMAISKLPLVNLDTTTSRNVRVLSQNQPIGITYLFKQFKMYNIISLSYKFLTYFLKIK